MNWPEGVRMLVDNWSESEIEKIREKKTCIDFIFVKTKIIQENWKTIGIDRSNDNYGFFHDIWKYL